MKMKKRKCKLIFICLILILTSFLFSFIKSQDVYAAQITDGQETDVLDTKVADKNETTSGLRDNGLNITYNGDETGLSGNLKILLVLTVISLAPSLLIMLTSFTRIIVVLHFTRSALATQTSPPNQVLVGLALFLTLFIMRPVFTEVYDTAIKPFDAGEITQEEAIETGLKPLRNFMYEQTQTKDRELFLNIAKVTDIETRDDVPITVLIPSFIISELRTAFIIGFLIYIPFIVIDMVVASTLMSMGMMMLPPTTISMPFKLLLFVLADGWNLIIGSLVKTFY